ncbi:N,N-dimethylformamidase beta subunit family domain-containing protein [Shinella sp.]|uniref:N,N-dimethylformamidase beta subunit family domain-containing protein n=1 Tax=Shinella sp. TaxID=1870904 RepID=UPI00299FAFA9|nr:N,N-dimethylformamidase beta subunit family domain-containing protein [Shinella sp.]MDX3973851.1 N,N-dimethylformamidase [Shinella sp.]
MLRITAYSSRISYRPGDEVDVKVSAVGMRTFDAALKRIIQGDINPEGPGYREDLVPTAIGGPFRAREQKIRTGSYGIARPTGLAVAGSITVAALIWPTLPGASRQAVVSIGAETGLRLGLDEEGRATFEAISGDRRIGRATTAVPCRAKAWYAIIGTFDPQTRRLHVEQVAIQHFPGISDSNAAQATAETSIDIDWSEVLFAAEHASGGAISSFYNGKIEAPFVCAGRPGAEGVIAHLKGQRKLEPLIADWDFAHDIANDTFADNGPRGLHGRFFNLPHRAVSGLAWDGSTYKWQEKPAHYAAVHFHDDDLYDAGWETDFTFRLPDDLKSGVYAAHLTSDDGDSEYYVVFAVRAARHARKAPVLFVMPTASYMAYANHRLGIDVSETEIGAGQLIQVDRHHAFLQENPQYGLSLYEVHSDGSGVFYSSRLRPVVDLQPKVQGFIGGLGSNVWQFNADTHILGFFENRGLDYDVVTDEDLETDGAEALTGYPVVVTGSHPEYTSTRMLDAYRDYSEGGRIMYLGGNGFYWRIAYSDTLPGVIECRRSESGIRGWEPGTGNYHHQFTGELGGLWRRIGRAPQQLFGVGMTAQGFDLSSPYVKTEAASDPRAAFIFEGIEEDVIGDFGLNGNGAAGNEIDRADFALGTPPNALVVASSRLHTDIYLMTPEDLLDPTPTWTGTQSDLIRSDMTFFETASGGAVFSTGSIAWAASMAWNGYDNVVARLTENVVRRFSSPEKF